MLVPGKLLTPDAATSDHVPTEAIPTADAPLLCTTLHLTHPDVEVSLLGRNTAENSLLIRLVHESDCAVPGCRYNDRGYAYSYVTAFEGLDRGEVVAKINESKVNSIKFVSLRLHAPLLTECRQSYRNSSVQRLELAANVDAVPGMSRGGLAPCRTAHLWTDQPILKTCESL